MNLAAIQNGLSFAGGTRKRNYKERACAPNGIKANPSYGQTQNVNTLANYKSALKLASRRLAVADEFIKSAANK